MSDLPKLTLTEMLLRLPEGEAFFTSVKDTVVGSYAHRAGVKVTTERMLAIHSAKRELIDVTRVTILSRGDSELTRKAKTIQRAAAESRLNRVRRIRVEV